jgi:hypothetical protein
MTPMATVNRHVPAVRPAMVLVAAAIAAFVLCDAVIRPKETGR